MPFSPLTRMFHLFESSYEPGFYLVSKIVANVIPRVAITRNANERQEVLFNEVTQGSLLFVSLPLVSLLADPIQAKVSGLPRELIKMKNEDAVKEAARLGGGQALVDKLKMAKLGKSIGASAFIAALLVATSYLRNYRTIKRTGFSDYKDVVGLNGKRQPTAEDRVKAEQAMRKNLRIMDGLTIGGAAAWMAIIAASGLMIRRGKTLATPLLDRMMKHWAFVGKRSDQINGPFRSQWQALAVWGIPSYLGWFLGCRDQYEVIEQTTKFLTFLGGYFWTPKLVKNFMDRRNAALLTRNAQHGPMTYTNIIENVYKKAPEAAQEMIKHKNTQWALLSAVNFLVAGALPLVFNIFFSKWRNAREKQAAQTARPPQPAFPLPVMPLQHKTIQQWGQRGAQWAGRGF